MINSLPRLTGGPNLFDRFRRWLPKSNSFRRQLRILKWLIPIGLVMLVVAYELGPSRWTYQSLGFNYHLLAEIILFGTMGPLLAFVLLELLGRWIDEKETADLQTRLLAEAGDKELRVRQLNDDTLQVLFATSLLITAIESDGARLSSNTTTQIKITEQALDEVMQRLRSHLLS